MVEIYPRKVCWTRSLNLMSDYLYVPSPLDTISSPCLTTYQPSASNLSRHLTLYIPARPFGSLNVSCSPWPADLYPCHSLFLSCIHPFPSSSLLHFCLANSHSFLRLSLDWSSLRKPRLITSSYHTVLSVPICALPIYKPSESNECVSWIILSPVPNTMSDIR